MNKVLILAQERAKAERILALPFLHSNRDFAVTMAIGNISQLVEMARHHRPCAIIFLTNPEHSQNEMMLSALKSGFWNIPIIVVGVDTSFEVTRQMFLQGAYDYITEGSLEVALPLTLERIHGSLGADYLTNVLAEPIDALAGSLLNGGDYRVGCRSILERIYFDWNHNLEQATMIAQKGKKQVYFRLIEMKPWLEKFLFKDSFICDNNGQVWDLQTTCHDWENDFDNVAKLITKFHRIDDKLVYRIGCYVVNHVDEKLDLSRVANGVYLNASYVSHIFKKVTKVSFIDFLTDMKMERAKVLLHTEGVKIYDIAFLLGYSNPEYFSKIFKKFTGMTPTSYRSTVVIH